MSSSPITAEPLVRGYLSDERTQKESISRIVYVQRDESRTLRIDNNSTNQQSLIGEDISNPNRLLHGIAKPHRVSDRDVFRL